MVGKFYKNVWGGIDKYYYLILTTSHLRILAKEEVLVNEKNEGDRACGLV